MLLGKLFKAEIALQKFGTLSEMARGLVILELSWRSKGFFALTTLARPFLSKDLQSIIK